jgi:hypothetical protein
MKKKSIISIIIKILLIIGVAYLLLIISAFIFLYIAFYQEDYPGDQALEKYFYKKYDIFHHFDTTTLSIIGPNPDDKIKKYFYENDEIFNFEWESMRESPYLDPKAEIGDSSKQLLEKNIRLLAAKLKLERVPTFSKGEIKLVKGKNGLMLSGTGFDWGYMWRLTPVISFKDEWVELYKNYPAHSFQVKKLSGNWFMFKEYR